MKQNIHIWLSLLLFGLLIIGLVDKAHASFPPRFKRVKLFTG